MTFPLAHILGLDGGFWMPKQASTVAPDDVKAYNTAQGELKKTDDKLKKTVSRLTASAAVRRALYCSS